MQLEGLDTEARVSVGLSSFQYVALDPVTGCRMCQNFAKGSF